MLNNLVKLSLYKTVIFSCPLQLGKAVVFVHSENKLSDGCLSVFFGLGQRPLVFDVLKPDFRLFAEHPAAVALGKDTKGKGGKGKVDVGGSICLEKKLTAV
jgi:hypothetical protein